jgi:hypothetical protein
LHKVQKSAFPSDPVPARERRSGVWMFVSEFIQALSGNDMHKVGQILSEAVSDEKHSAFNIQYFSIP